MSTAAIRCLRRATDSASASPCACDLASRRRQASVGDYFWGGLAGTTFRISPRDSLFAIFMTQAPDNREHFGWTFGNLLNAAIL